MTVTTSKQVLYEKVSNFPANFSETVDLGSGPNRVAFVAIGNEAWVDLDIGEMFLGSDPLGLVFKDVVPGSGHNEYLTIYALTNPPEGIQELTMDNASSSVDVRVVLYMLDGVSQLAGGQPLFNIQQSGSTIETGITLAEGQGALFVAVRNGSEGGDFDPLAGVRFDQASLGYNGTGLSMAAGFIEGPGQFSAGFQQPGTSWQSIVAAIPVIIAGAGTPDPDPDPDPDPTPGEYWTKAEADARYAKKTELQLVQDNVDVLDDAITDLEANKLSQAEGDVRYELKGQGTGNGNGSPIIIAGGNYIMGTADFDGGMAPSSSPSQNRANLQGFLDYLYSLGDPSVQGLIGKGHWKIDSTLYGYEGMDIRGASIKETFIEGDPSTWSRTRGGNPYFTLLELRPTTRGENRILDGGIKLRDMKIQGAERSPTDSGPLIRLQTINDVECTRLALLDASSYGLFITGYGLGSYQDDPTSDYWNNSQRARVRDCYAVRGQIGFGLEGGAQDVEFQHLFVYDCGHAAFRLAASKNARLHRLGAYRSKIGYWLDRCEGLQLTNSHTDQCRMGVTYSGAETGADGGPSRNMKILFNTFDTTTGSCISDSFIGSNDQKYVDGVDIIGNTFTGGGRPALLSKTRNINAQMNRSEYGGTFKASGAANGTHLGNVGMAIEGLTKL